MKEDVEDLNQKRTVMLNLFRKDHDALKRKFDRFVRADVNDMKSLKLID